VVYCTHCNSGSGIRNVADLRDHVFRKIEGNVRTGRWKNSRKMAGDAENERASPPAAQAAAAATEESTGRSQKKEEILLELADGRRRTARQVASRVEISADRAEVFLEDLRAANLVSRQDFHRLEFEDPKASEWRLTTGGQRYLAARNLIE
jgi:predicted HTH transcriptional regulator